MRILVWQWGRRGGGPRFAHELAQALQSVPGTQALLSLSRDAEILRGPDPPHCALPVATYTSLCGMLRRLVAAPLEVARLAVRLRRLRPDVAICALPGPLDLLMVAALRRISVPLIVVVHDADAHPGDGFPLQMRLQRVLVGAADGLVALSSHVADRLREQGLARTRPLLAIPHPPRSYGPMPEPRAHGGRLRLLLFGRLLPYKGLDLLAEAWAILGRQDVMELRVVGRGPESSVLDALRRLPGVTVENRWVPEAEIGALLAWSDAVVLSHREASQSGIAASAIAAGRWLVATRVGGLVEQVGQAQGAILCDVNAASLAAALARLLQAPPDLPRQADPMVAWHRLGAELVCHLGAQKKVPGSARTRQRPSVWKSFS